MIVLIDNGHGVDTPGKRSPDRQIYEYKYAREIASLLEEQLKKAGVSAVRIVREENDVPLSERIKRVNTICKERGSQNCCLVSIHCNACPPNDDKWHPARGWSAWTSRGKTRGDILANHIYIAAESILSKDYTETFADTDWKRKNKPVRTDMSDGDRDFEADFAICKKTNCAAVLTENLFQDNKDDVAFLLSDKGKDAIVQLHLNGILNYIKSL